MECPFCGNDDQNLISKTPLKPRISTTKSETEYRGYGTEYFCNYCGEYWSWRQTTGLCLRDKCNLIAYNIRRMP